MCGWPSSTVTIGATRSAANSSSRIASSPSAQALPRLQRPEHEVGRGQAHDVARDAGAGERVGGREHLGHHRADADQRHAPAPVAAVRSR